jgi:epoxide hydrolase-like predicted phosphatase
LNSNEIENIIFDLGGVIINLHIDATFQKFSEIFKREINTEIFEDHDKYAFFKEYEVGKITSGTFRNHIRELAGLYIEDAQIDDAWNAMLRDIPADRIGWIYEATQNYNCVVLSNTNEIHIRHFANIFNRTTLYGFPQDIFQKVFCSHEIGERKPDARAFEIVLEATGFDPAKTVLFDDLKDNLKSAKQLGIRTVHVERNNLRREQLPDGRI